MISACASSRHLRRRGLAGADRPHGLVRDHQLVVGRENGHLAAQNGLRLPRFALCFGLTDARDHVEARSERGLDAPRDGLVGLAEVLPALGVADERSVHAELAQHRRRDLAGECALVGPVAVLREDADLGAGQRLHGLLERDERRADDDVDIGRQVGLAQRAAERCRLRRAP